MSNGHLSKRYSELSDEDLLSIINEKAEDYTMEAIETAKEELERRKSGEKKDPEEKGLKEGEKYHIPHNFIEVVLKIAGGIVTILGIIFGIAILGIAAGLLLVGLGEVINLLHQINQRLKFNQERD